MVKTRRNHKEQVAFDGGYGQRGVSHRHENPYDVTGEVELHAAWEDGWKAADREANKSEDDVDG